MPKMVTRYYCNCCGEDFTTDEKKVVCPNCECVYRSNSNRIEKYNACVV